MNSKPGIKARARDPERRRREILHAAADILVEQGTAGLTHRAVAARAGVALGSTTRYFASIDDLRDSALRVLWEEIDSTVDVIEYELSKSDDVAGRCGALVHDFLQDSRQVHATMALTHSATSDTQLRTLSLAWTERLTAVLAQYAGRERAAAVEIFINGATVHAALQDSPLSEDMVTRVIRAILAMPEGKE